MEPDADAAFAPPEEQAGGGAGPTATVAAWALAMATAGTAAGSAVEMTAGAGAMPIALAGGALGAALGLGAYGVERRLSATRPAVHDGRGRLTRPLRSWLLGIPLGVGILGLLGLVVVGTVHTGSPLVGVGFLILAAGFATAGRPLVASHALTRAIELAEGGRSAEAEARLLRLFRAWWAPASSRDQAALNLGLLALGRADLPGAARWYLQPRRGRTRAFARAGLALVRVLQGQLAEAEVPLREASTGGRAVQREVDGVRLLLVLRRDGPVVARALGDRLASDESGALLLGVLAWCHRATGNEPGAEALLAAGLEDALRGSALTTAVPELASLLDPLED